MHERPLALSTSREPQLNLRPRDVLFAGGRPHLAGPPAKNTASVVWPDVTPVFPG
jgi:hypothetical protein